MQSHLLAAAALAAGSLASTILLGGCAHPTRAQYDIDRGWSVYGQADATVRGREPEVGPEQLAKFVDSGERVVLTGTVDQVCRTMGCWLDIAGKSGEVVRVMNKDHGFFIPRNARGRTVHAVGFVTERELSVEMLRHLAEDAGRSQAEIDSITAPRKSVLFIADAVILPPGGLDAPAAAPVAGEGGAQ
jgi:hypothetical protein